MCMIVIKPKGKRIPTSNLRNAYLYNKDGFGIATVDSLYRTSDFNEFLDKLKEYDEVECIVHMRNSSAGSSTEARNIQPIKTRHGYFAHNGTVCELAFDDILSDSYHLAKIINEMEMGEYSVLALQAILKNDRAVLFGKNGLKIWGHWFEENGIKYSSDYYKDIDSLNWDDFATMGDFFVAVYGTLKAGYGNHHLLLDEYFIDNGVTVEKFPMVDGSFPYLYNEPGLGKYCEVEVYTCSKNTLKKLDELEGVDFGHYYRDEIEVELSDGSAMTCYVYFAAHDFEGDPNEDTIECWYGD